MTMDIFNKKKIGELEQEIGILKVEIEVLKTKPKCYEMGEPMAENSILRKLADRLMAIADYLKIEFKNEYVDDPIYPTPEPIKKKIVKAVNKIPDKKENI